MEQEYIAYEYKEITAEQSDAPFLRDSYENFGWEVTRTEKAAGAPAAAKRAIPAGKEKIVLQMRRNRKLVNRAELLRLQRHFESCVRDVAALEKEKSRLADIVSIAVGVAGTAFLAASVMAYTANPPLFALFVVCAVPGIAGWALPYFLYRGIREKKTAQIAPLIEKKYDEMYEICEKGYHLLHR